MMECRMVSCSEKVEHLGEKGPVECSQLGRSVKIGNPVWCKEKRRWHCQWGGAPLRTPRSFSFAPNRKSYFPKYEPPIITD